MSYFTAQPRGVKVTKGSLGDVRWPSAATIRAELTPHEVFGASNKTYPRVFLVAGAKAKAVWNSNTGEGGMDSDIFFEELDVRRTLPGGISLSLRGNVAEAETVAATEETLSAVVGFLEFDLPAFLSLLLRCFVRVTGLTGTLSGNVEFRLQLRESWHGFTSMDHRARDARVNRAADFAQAHIGSESRYLYACLYYQQALRNSSPHECTLPALHIPELVVNLAKSIEILFPGGHDSVREGCRRLGYSADEIERNIVPLLLIRNEFDIAHPVAARVPYEDVQTVYKYVLRSQQNVRSLLLRVGRHMRSGTSPVIPLSSDTSKRRAELCRRLRDHMRHPILPDEEK